jgi:choline dehydrogenase-like flavoprotein
LWAADASVMPDLVSTHPNATVVMIGERAASLINSNGSD